MFSILLALSLSQPPFGPVGETPGQRTVGDSPPSSPFVVTGSLDIAFSVAGEPSYGFNEFLVANIPDDASVQHAFLVTGIWSDN